jgi:DNA polymerase III delta prime subunit
MRGVKQLSLDMYSIAKDRERLRRDGREKSIVEPRLNFAFMGNPGCGKTESARLFSKILVKSGLRPDNFIELTAQQALQMPSMGPGSFCDMIEKSNLAAPKSKSNVNVGSPSDLPSGKFMKKEAVEVQLAQGGAFVKAKIIDVPESKVQGLPNSSMYDVQLEDGIEVGVEPSKIRRFKPVVQPPGGILFIDEAYILDPSQNATGRSIFNEIMRISEDHRDTVTVILSGYRNDIEQKLFNYNPGCFFPSHGILRLEVMLFQECPVASTPLLSTISRSRSWRAFGRRFAMTKVISYTTK